jgi:hypothetical protein
MSMFVSVVRPGDLTDRFPERNPRNFEQMVLAEGDSWFSLGGVPAGNILYQLKSNKSTLVVTIADPGDTMVHVGNPDNLRELRRLVALPQFAYKWKCILLSGGGNDLIDNAATILVNTNPASSAAADYINAAALDQVLQRVQAAYRAIVAMRDDRESVNRDVPIYVHTYDYPTPRNAPARFLGAGIQGPWLFRALSDKGIPPAMWQQVSDRMLDKLAEAILALDGRTSPTGLPNFFVVNTRGVLSRARPETTGSEADWLNEIHPNASGNGKLAGILSEAMTL